MHIPMAINVFPWMYIILLQTSWVSHKPLITGCNHTNRTVNTSLSFFKLGGVDSSVIWGYLRVQSRIVFPLGASVLSLILSITSQAFVSLVLFHKSWRSKLWACNKLPGRAPALRSVLSPYSATHDQMPTEWKPVSQDQQLCMHMQYNVHSKMDS